ncbi:MAG: hypothetical protein GWN13_08775 [Phycisphaerae bacterium]|nr:hypothetical protein [Phycisphaerae bacterium]
MAAGPVPGPYGATGTPDALRGMLKLMFCHIACGVMYEERLTNGTPSGGRGSGPS